MEVFDVHNMYVQLTMVIKIQQLQRESLSSLTYKNLEDYLSSVLWKSNLPGSLHEAADQILSVKGEQIVRFLTSQAIKEGSRVRLDDFSDLIGGN